MFTDTTDLAQTFEPIVRELAPAVARGEPVLLVGSPGVGKTMITRRMVGAVALDEHAARWIAAEYEGTFGERPRDVAVPFRAPHHTISDAAMRGSSWSWKHHPACMSMTYPWCACGKEPNPRTRSKPLPCPAYVKTDPGSRGGVWTPGKPGEVELARFGVLYLDELVEFRRSTIEATRDRLRTMAAGRPRVIASVNPCPCGWHGTEVRTCACTEPMRERWGARVDQFATILGITKRIAIPSVSVRDLQAQRAAPRCPSIKTILAEMSA